MKYKLTNRNPKNKLWVKSLKQWHKVKVYPEIVKQMIKFDNKQLV